MTRGEADRPFTLDEAADELRCSKRWLQGWLKANPSHGYKVGREYRFTSFDIAGMRRALRVQPAEVEMTEDEIVLARALELCARKRKKPRDPSFNCYAMSAGGLVKLGVAKDVAERRAFFQTGSAHEIKVIATWPGDRFDEARAHEALKRYRVQGEWFRDCDTVRAFIHDRLREAGQ